MNLFILTLLGLATWRCASLLAREDGPYDIFTHIRHLAGVQYDEHSEPYATDGLSRAILCVWCNSVWIGWGWTILYFVLPNVIPWLAAPLALSAIAIMVDKVNYG